MKRIEFDPMVGDWSESPTGAWVDADEALAIERAAWRLIATWHRGERMTGRSLPADVAELERALRAAQPQEPPLPPAWTPDGR